jgi:hypothetical protein
VIIYIKRVNVKAHPTASAVGFFNALFPASFVGGMVGIYLDFTAKLW